MPTLSERIQEAINTAQEYNDLPLSERIQLQIDMANQERNRKEMGITERSLKRGLYQMGSMGGGMVGIAGSLAGKIGVPEHIAGPIRDWGAETYSSLGRKASLYPADTETSFDLLTSPSQAAKWTWESIVENLPYMAVTFGTSAAWKVVGSKVASGVLGGAIERLTGKKLALDAMERFGSRFGLVSTTAALEGGGMWGETLERSGVDNPISAIAGGTVNGFIELAGGMSSVFDRVLGVTRGNLYRQAVGNMRKAVSAGQTISPKDASIVNRLLHELRTTAPEEFQQELFQELVTLSNIAINDPTFEVFTQKNVERLADAGARGGAAGFGTGVMALPLQDRYSLVREKVESLDPAELRQAIQSQSKLLEEQPENEDLRQVIRILLQRQLRDTHAGYRELLDAYNRTKDPAIKKQLGEAIIAAQVEELRRLKEEGAEKKYTILRDTGEPGEKTKPGEPEKKYTILKDTGEPDEKYTNLRVLTENPTEVVLVPEGEGAARVSRAPEGEGAARVSRAPEGEGAARVSRAPEGEGASRVSRVPEGELATSISEGKEAAGAVNIPEKELRTRYKAPEGEEGGLVMRVPEGEGAASVVNIPEEESATRISRVRRETPKGEGAARWGENTEDLINAWTHGKQVPPNVFRGATPEEEERVREQRHREWEGSDLETNLDRFIDQSLRSRLGELLDKRLRSKLEREEEKRRWRELEKKVKPEIPPKPAVPKQAAVPELPQKYIPSPKLARVARELRVSHQEIVNAYLDSILTGKPPQGNKNLRRALIEISIDPQSDEIRSLQVGALIELRNRTGLIPSRKEVRRMFVIEAQEADDLLREAFGPGWAQEQDMLQRLAQGGKRTGTIPTLILTSSGKPFLTEKATTARRRELKAQGIDTVPVPVEGGFGLKRIEKEGSKHDRKNKKGLGSKIGERQKPGRPVPESGRGQETTAAGGVLQTQKGKEIKPVVPAEKPTIPTPVEEKPTTPTPVEEKPTTPTPVEEKPTTPTPVEEKPTTPTPVEEKPTTPTPVEEKPTTPTPVEEKPTTPTPTEEKPTTPTPPTPSSEEERMVTPEEFQAMGRKNAEDWLKSLPASKVLEYARAWKMPLGAKRTKEQVITELLFNYFDSIDQLNRIINYTEGKGDKNEGKDKGDSGEDSTGAGAGSTPPRTTPPSSGTSQGGGSSTSGGKGESGASGPDQGTDENIQHTESSTGANLPGTGVSGTSVEVEGQPPTGRTGEGVGGDRTDELVPVATGTDVERTEPSVGQHNYDLRQKPGVVLTRSERIRINEQAREIIARRANAPETLTEEEKDILRQYTGAGGIASGTIEALNQHYTDYETVRAIYRALDDAGFQYQKALEPAVGSGNFVGHRPDLDWTTVDIDKTNYEIVKLLYPQAKHYNISFEDFKAGGFDLIISNVPFLETRGNRAVKNLPHIKTLHDFYFVSALDKVNDNGIVAFITSTGTMDKQDDSVRREIVSKADVIGAYRLPEGHFSANANTKVTTDVIFLQKRPEGVIPSQEQQADNQAFIESRLDENDLRLNSYYKLHPENILGELVQGKDEMYGGRPKYQVQGQADLSKIKINLRPGTGKSKSTVPSKKVVEIPRTVEGVKEWADQQGFLLRDYTGNVVPSWFKENILIQDGKVYVEEHTLEYSDVEGEAKLFKELTGQNADKILQLNEIKKLAERFQETEEPHYAEQGAQAVQRYKDQFKKAPTKDAGLKGLFTKKDEKTLFNDLSGYFNENFELADVFKVKTRYTGSGKIEVTDQSPLVERAFFNEDTKGMIRFPEAKFLSMDEIPQLILNGYAVIQYNSDSAVLQNEILYYSGNVYTKGDEAQRLLNRLAQSNSEAHRPILNALENQITNLKDLRPEPTTLEEILFKGNEGWLFPLIGERVGITKAINHRTGKYEYTYRRNRIYEQYLNNRVLVSRDQEESIGLYMMRMREAEETVEEVRDAIRQQIREDPELLQRVEYAYNSIFRGHVAPNYSKARYLIRDVLDEIEAESPIRLRQNQIEWIIQAVYEGRGINAHDVGGGKTFAAIALARVLKKRGIAQKPMFVVPAKTIKKWERDIRTLFPKAKIFNLGKLAKDKRESKLLELANTNVDYVLISHEGFGQIKLDPETEVRYVEDLVHEHIDDPNLAGRDRAIMLINAERYKSAIRNEDRNTRITFDKLGIDMLVADEAHAFKNIGVRGELVRFGLGIGLSISDTGRIESKRSYDFRFKANHIVENNNGKNVYLLTATPTPNKPMELYTMIRHLSKDVFHEYGIRRDVDFANSFFKLGTRQRVGREEAKNILTHIVNVPELRGIIERFIDKRSIEDMPWITIPEEREHRVFLNRSEEYASIARDLLYRQEHLPTQPQEGDDTLMAIYSGGRAGSTDPRLYGGPHANISVDTRSHNTSDDKLEYVINAVYNVWKSNPNVGQLVFMDELGAAQVARGVLLETMHEEIKTELVKRGMDPKEVAIINGGVVTNPKTGRETKSSSDKDQKKQDIADLYNEGKIKVIIGSTSAMGEGMDLQVKTSNIYHLDIPWTPGAYRQRNGRGIRFGNENKHVDVHYLFMRGSFDLISFETVSHKKGWNEAIWDRESANAISVEEEMLEETIPMRERILIEMEPDPVRRRLLELQFEYNSILDERRTNENNRRSSQRKYNDKRLLGEAWEQELAQRRQRLATMEPDPKIADEAQRAEQFEKAKSLVQRTIDNLEKRMAENRTRMDNLLRESQRAESEIQRLTERIRDFETRYFNSEGEIILPDQEVREIRERNNIEQQSSSGSPSLAVTQITPELRRAQELKPLNKIKRTLRTIYKGNFVDTKSPYISDRRMILDSRMIVPGEGESVEDRVAFLRRMADASRGNVVTPEQAENFFNSFNNEGTVVLRPLGWHKEDRERILYLDKGNTYVRASADVIYFIWKYTDFDEIRQNRAEIAGNLGFFKNGRLVAILRPELEGSYNQDNSIDLQEARKRAGLPEVVEEGEETPAADTQAVEVQAAETPAAESGTTQNPEEGKSEVESKQPWQMTLEEYKDANWDRVFQSELESLKSRTANRIESIRRELASERGAQVQKPHVINSLERHLAMSESKLEELNRGNYKQWEDDLKIATHAKLNEDHRREVQQASQSGHEIPPNVLQRYPEFGGKEAGPEAPGEPKAPVEPKQGKAVLMQSPALESFDPGNRKTLVDAVWTLHPRNAPAGYIADRYKHLFPEGLSLQDRIRIVNSLYEEIQNEGRRGIQMSIKPGSRGAVEAVPYTVAGSPKGVRYFSEDESMAEGAKQTLDTSNFYDPTNLEHNRLLWDVILDTMVMESEELSTPGGYTEFMQMLDSDPRGGTWEWVNNALLLDAAKKAGFTGAIGNNRGKAYYAVFDQPSGKKVPTSQKPGYGLGSKEETVRNYVKSLNRHFNIPIDVVQSVRDLPAKYAREFQERGRPGDILRGIYDPETGVAYLIADGIDDRREALTVVLHEVVGHAGLRKVLGKEYEGFLKWMANGKYKKEIRSLNRERGYNDPLRAAEEWFAEQVEEGTVHSTLWNRFVHFIKQQLRKLGFNIEFGKTDLVELVRRSHRAVTWTTDVPESHPSNPTFNFPLFQEKKNHQGSESPLFSVKSESNKDWTSWFDAVKESMDTVRDWLQEMREGKDWKIEKPDTTWLERIFATPSYYFGKVPALQRVMNAALEESDNRVLFQNMLFNADGGKGESYITVIENYRRADPDGYKQWSEYIVKRDRDAIGYTVRKENDRFAVFRPSGEKVKDYAKWEDAWVYAFEREAEESGFTEMGKQALIAYRTIALNTYQMLSEPLRKIIAEAEAEGRTLPTVAYQKYEKGKNGKLRKTTVEVDLRLALDLMGERLGYYLPRLRRQGGYQLIATKEGEPSYLQFFKTRMGLDQEAAVLRKQGYTIHKGRANRLPGDVFGELGQTMAMEEIINQALKEMRGLGKKTLADFGLQGEWGKTSDGKDEFVVTGTYDSRYVEAFKTVKGHGFYNGAWHFKEPGDNIEETLIKRLGEFSTNLNLELTFAQGLIQNVADILRSHGSLAHRIRRSEAKGEDVWRGYSEEPLEAIVTAGRNIAAGHSKGIMARKMYNAIMGRGISWREFQIKNEDADYEDYLNMVNERKIDPAKQPNAYKDGVDYMKDMLRSSEPLDRLIGIVKGFAMVKYIAGRVSAPVVNLTALPTVVVSSMKGYADISIPKSIRMLTVAAKDYWNFWRHPEKMDPETLDLFKEIHNRGWDMAQYNEEALQALRGQVARRYDRVIDWLMMGFKVSEQVNRVTTIVAAYRGIKSAHKGEWTRKDYEEAMEKAKFISDRAHSIYGKVNAPMLMRGGGVFAETAKSFYMFKNFAHNYLQNLVELGFKKKDAAAVTWLVLSPAIIGGATAALPITLLVQALRSVMDDDPEEEALRFLQEHLGDEGEMFGRYGLFGLGNINIKGSLQVGITDVPTKITDVLGAPYDVWLDVTGGIGDLIRGNTSKGIEKITPLFVGNILKAHRELTEGVTNRTNAPLFEGNTAVRANALDAALRALSFNPARLARIHERYANERLTEKEFEESRTDIYSKFRKYFLAPEQQRSQAQYIKLLDEIKEYNTRVQSVGRGDIPLITGESLRNVLREALRPSRTERLRASGSLYGAFMTGQPAFIPKPPKPPRAPRPPLKMLQDFA